MATEGTGFLVSKSLEKSNIYRLIQTKIFDEKKKNKKWFSREFLNHIDS